ncbi:MAG: hypothetical protein A2Z72_08220 [Omnitrophica bacterium RBG_13_46_9]|nr:MAG: hypothetical protein A2Z72_08220 [Omnitrophica bacterium RBG_13_46_9]
MPKKIYRYVYGPVSSWRLGRSLGIDPVSSKRGRICTFNCVYCQIGKVGSLTDKRKVFVPAARIIEELKAMPPLKIDYITFSGAGDPALAKNLGEIINGVRKIRKEKIAILTNSSMLSRKDVQEDLMLADFVIAKLDAHTQRLFAQINRPMKGITLDAIVKGVKGFRSRYKGKLAPQIMFVDINKGYAEEIARLAGEIRPDQIQINTPLRPCGVRPLPKKELDRIKGFFKGNNCISVFEAGKKKVKPISAKDVLRRRGKA